MELRTYWNIIRRRWLLLVIPAVIVLAIGLLTYQPPAQAYNVGARFIVGQAPGPESESADEQRYWAWVTSEYIVDGIVNWVRSRAFAEQVSARLIAEGHDIPAAAIQIAADNERSQMTMSMSSTDPDALALIMDMAIRVMIEDNVGALPQLGEEAAVITVLDEPVVGAIPAGIGAQLDLVVRVAIAIAAGIGLVFLAEYLDPTVRQRNELEQLGLSVLGEIPNRKTVKGEK